MPSGNFFEEIYKLNKTYNISFKTFRFLWYIPCELED